MTKGTKNKKIEAVEAKMVLDSVQNLNLNNVVTEVGNLQVSIQGTLANLSGSLSAKIQQMEQLNTAIELKSNRLQELHGIENIAISLDEMKFQKEEEEKQAALSKAERVKNWLDEEVDHAKVRKQQENEWNYEWGIKIRKIKDDFDVEVENNKRNEKIRQDLLKRGWDDRETTLKSKEQEFVVLTKQIGEFEGKMKSEVSRAEAVVANTLRRDYDHQIALLKKDVEAEKAKECIRIGAYELTVKGLEEQVRDLKTQLVAARTDARDVATQALQSASGRQVVDALQKVCENKEPTKNK